MAGLIVGIIAVAVIAVFTVAIIAFLVYGLVMMVVEIVMGLYTAITDDTLTVFERGSHAGESTMNIVLLLLPFKGKIKGRFGRWFGRSKAKGKSSAKALKTEQSKTGKPKTAPPPPKTDKPWLEKKGDPAYDRYGPASESHPEQLAQTIAKLEKAGVEVIWRPDALAYQPNSTPGKPGQMILDPDASWSAVVHEMQHFLDDAAKGFLGAEKLYNPNTRWWFESRAYAKEIALARREGDKALIKELETLRLQEWQKIFMPDLGKGNKVKQ